MLRRQLTAGAASAAAWRGALSALRTQVSWAHVPEAPKDPILGVSERYIACTDPDKMNLGGEPPRELSFPPANTLSSRLLQLGGCQRNEYRISQLLERIK